MDSRFNTKHPGPGLPHGLRQMYSGPEPPLPGEGAPPCAPLESLGLGPHNFTCPLGPSKKPSWVTILPWESPKCVHTCVNVCMSCQHARVPVYTCVYTCIYTQVHVCVWRGQPSRSGWTAAPRKRTRRSHAHLSPRQGRQWLRRWDPGHGCAELGTSLPSTLPGTPRCSIKIRLINQ